MRRTRDVHVTLSDDEKRRADAAAKQAERSLADYTRRALLRAVKKQEQEPPKQD